MYLRGKNANSITRVTESDPATDVMLLMEEISARWTSSDWGVSDFTS